MANLKVNRGAASPTPTQQMTEDANRSHVVVDSKGRRITLQKPGLLSQFRIVKIVGGETATNRVYMNMILPVTFVTAIDDLPVPTPTNQAQLDALIQRLDEHGIDACIDGLNEFWGGQADQPDDKLEAVKA